MIAAGRSIVSSGNPRMTEVLPGFTFPLAEKHTIDGVLGLIDTAVTQSVDEFLERGQFFIWNLNANQNASVVGPLIAVMEETDVPTGMHPVQKPHESAGAFWKFEAVEPFISAQSTSPAKNRGALNRRMEGRCFWTK